MTCLCTGVCTLHISCFSERCAAHDLLVFPSFSHARESRDGVEKASDSRKTTRLDLLRRGSRRGKNGPTEVQNRSLLAPHVRLPVVHHRPCLIFQHPTSRAVLLLSFLNFWARGLWKTKTLVSSPVSLNFTLRSSLRQRTLPIPQRPKAPEEDSLCGNVETAFSEQDNQVNLSCQGLSAIQPPRSSSLFSATSLQQH